MAKPSRKKSLYDAYRFPGFTPSRTAKGRFGDHTAFVIRLNRRKKKRHVEPAVLCELVGMTDAHGTFAISLVVIGGFIWKWTFAESTAEGVVL